MEHIFRPKSLAELDDIIRGHQIRLTLVAGATDLMVQPQSWHRANHLVDLTAIREMHEEIGITDDQVLIGAAVPLSQIIAHPILQQRLPILVAACRQIGSVQIQNRATLGGNIANASPAADSLPVLSVLQAELLIGPQVNGQFEKLNIDHVMLNPGETCLSNNRYIAYIHIPLPSPENLCWYFRKVGPRRALAISKVSLALLSWRNNNQIEEIRITLGSVTPQIKRAAKTEALLTGRVLTAELIERARLSIKTEVKPITDIRSTIAYREHICGELLREALYQIIAQTL